MLKKRFSQRQLETWLARFPKKLVTAKAIIRTDRGNVLIVEPNYQESWQLPGGGVESGEGPEEALVREVAEELSLTIKPEALKLTDVIYHREYDNLILVYEYTGTISEEQPLQVQRSELDGYKFVAPDKISISLGDHYSTLCQRLADSVTL